MSKTICVKTFANREGAEIAKSMLEAHEIKALVYADDTGVYGQLSTAGGVRLFVLEEDADRAVELLQDTQGEQVSHEGTVGNSTEQDVIFECDKCGESITFPAAARGRVETCPCCYEFVDVPE